MCCGNSILQKGLPFFYLHKIFYTLPLGAIYSIFNPISIFRYRLDKDKCINCGKCKKVCQMNIDPVENCNHLECIRCGRCKNACPVDAISYGVRK
ncbi:TPA: 4Fe-4S binding protein [Enterococcus faecalis]